MGRLFNAYLFKLRHDLTFKITLIIGVALAVFMAGLYLLLQYMTKEITLTGQLMLIASLSPAQNFGLAIPVNLITFTVLEFTQGSIRNKIIAGHSKGKLYVSLCLNGLVFSFVLITVYVLLSFGLGSIFGGFDPEGSAMSVSALGMVKMAPFYLVKLLVVAVFIYIGITCFAIFIATLFRSIGPSIPIVIVVIVFTYLVGTVITSVSNDATLTWIVRILDPYYALGANELEAVSKTVVDGKEVVTQYQQTLFNETVICGIVSNIVYSALFFIGGLIIFKKRDVK